MKDNIEKIKDIKDIKEVFINFIPIFFNTKKTINIFSMCFYRIKKEDKKKKINKYMVLNDDKYKVSFLFKKGLIRITIKKYTYYFNIYKASFEKEKLLSYPPQNLIKCLFENEEKEITLPVVYNLIYFKKSRGLTSRIYKIDNSNLVCYFRQARLNSIAITVRNANETDKFSNKVKIFFAKILSLITPKKDIILMYEKESNKYEESASMVYERLIDKGYKNVYYIIRKNSPHVSLIKDKYKDNIIYSFTFKHFYYFFKCHKFIGTESVPHSIELRAANKYIARRFVKKDYKQVFLQHGVMYMIALDSKTRGSFRKNGNELPIDAKIVVSSKLEADHFVELGGFDYDDLYITGLPFYDRTIKKDDADKIVIMPTWRNWDYNILMSDYKKSSYYNFVKRIIGNIPKEYMDKVYVLPHPLVLELFKKTDLANLIPDMISYDKVLEETNLLITDYSSISYSAFYRGSNVIFCWEELDDCMKEYESHLMLNDDNVFGDVAYKSKDIYELVKKNYNKPQQEKYKERYKKIVEFSDNKNTERLIKHLKDDKLI